MKILIFVISIIIFIRTLSYSIFEIKEKNKAGGIIVIIFSIISLLLPNIVVYLRGI